MKPLNFLVCEFDLSSAEAAKIRALLSALNLSLDDSAVMDSVRATLRHAGIQAFDLDFLAELWSVEISYDNEQIVPDTDRAVAEIRRVFRTEGEIEWKPWSGSRTVAAGFGFSCPEGWMPPLPKAFGHVIREKLHEIVLANSRPHLGARSV